MSEDRVRLLRGAASGRSLVGAALMGTLERSEPTPSREIGWIGRQRKLKTRCGRKLPPLVFTRRGTLVLSTKCPLKRVL